ncbi:putative MFS family arabinose efflux permease [Thermosporothrix hazakensis]|uniref:Putative MFS family arabinose efflux permease n=1 Tax=Thermosporothrix hazakensis TaxID=644383 RepID=A0A326U3I5_THEHA|nr:MFS transporter [Thermosporothrix hazakensis]PZW26649.1 putative MFS family arabinose efflux permease [Thermosporothrix hazakensis]GCE47649.1 MFS transporter [Thermosporothrix hazakensis]
MSANHSSTNTSVSEHMQSGLPTIPDTPVWRNRTLLAISLAVCVTYIGLSMVTPIRVLYAEQQGASLTIISMMANAFLISNFAFQFPAGWLSDKLGHKRLMIIGLILQAILTIIYLVITDPILFIVLRFLEGMVGAAVAPAGRALVIEAVPEHQRGEAFGIFGAALNVGFLLGPGLGGLLGYTNTFIGSVVTRLIGLVLIITLVKGGISHKITQTKQKTKLPLHMLFPLGLIGAYVIAFGDYLFLGFDQTVMPIWLHNDLGATVTVVGIIYMLWSVPNIILSPLGGRLADRLSRKWIILVGGLLQVPLYMAYGLANSATLVGILFVIHGAVYGLMLPALDAHVATSSTANTRAQIQGLYNMFGFMGAFVGSTLFLPLYHLNFRLPLVVNGIGYGISILIGCLIIFASQRKRA